MLAAAKPRLVLCSISGFGPGPGPRSGQLGLCARVHAASVLDHTQFTYPQDDQEEAARRHLRRRRCWPRGLCLRRHPGPRWRRLRQGRAGHRRCLMDSMIQPAGLRMPAGAVTRKRRAGRSIRPMWARELRHRGAGHQANSATRRRRSDFPAWKKNDSAFANVAGERPRRREFARSAM